MINLITDAQIVRSILEDTKQGKLIALRDDNKIFLNNLAVKILNDNNPDEITKQMMLDIVTISNILYSNYSSEILVLEDGVYDLLMVKCKQCCSSYPVGAIPVNFGDVKNEADSVGGPKDYIYPMITLSDKEMDGLLFKNDIVPDILGMMDSGYLFRQNTEPYTEESHKNLDTKHGYLSLVGTLDKCKFVLNAQAEEHGVLKEPNVKIFERDFLGKHVSMGLVNPGLVTEMVLSLKYDGVSVEADIWGDKVVGARSRGDTENDIAMDVTPIFYGYTFPYASREPAIMHPNGSRIPRKFGMKFEAIITKDNLQMYNRIKGYNYVNCRTAIISIFNSTDGYKFRNLITLVPIQSSLLEDEFENNRLYDIEFLNKYYRTIEPFRYTIVRGNYTELLFQIKRFTEESEMMRKIMSFMFDGIVAEYTDPSLKFALGRQNSVNQWQMAIKFNALKRQTTFRGYRFTVGQDGSITPMIYYDPVEFYGTIHPKSSGHSYERFKKLGLKYGDIIDVSYEHDVMPYVTKPDNSHNANNPEPPWPFPTNCPFCDSPIVISPSEKSAKCPNFECPARSLSRIVSMMKKLGIKGFADESMDKLARKSLRELVSLTMDDVQILGEENGKKFLDRIYHLMHDPIYDYKIIGSLGFESLAEVTWKTIFKTYTLSELMSMSPEQMSQCLSAIKGIGPETIKTILRELPYFKNDIEFIMSMPNVVPIKGVDQLIVRFTGVRDIDLSKILGNLNCDVREGSSVTKDTNLLIVPSENHNSNKVRQARNYGIKILPIQEVYRRVNSGINLMA